MEKMIKPLKIKEIFKDGRYTIPIYQRNYAWTMIQVEQLIEDVANAAKDNQLGKYYIGNLIVDNVVGGENYETIDGQQRLTTIFIIISALGKIKEINTSDFIPNTNCLTFEFRDNSDNSLSRVWNGNLSEITKDDLEKDIYELHILDIFKSTVKIIKKKCKERGVSLANFCGFFLNNVIILRISVPEGIDKNHYFEVMNSRGIQLEQHEIIKSKLMGKLKFEKDKKAFEIIWNACSEMDRFVQMNFNTDQRRIIFGQEWTDDPETDFRTLSDTFNANPKCVDDSEKESSLRELIDRFNIGKPLGEADFKDDKIPEERFHPIIYFPNFLLHVLKILRPQHEVPFYDKWLSKTFDDVLKKEKDPSKFARDFASCLLECRYLLDSYIIRRDREDKWGIYSMETTDSSGSRKSYPKLTFGEESSLGNELVLVLSMFHFATPSMNYKNWLDGALTYLYKNSMNITGEDYLDYLKNLAKSYMLDWYFCKGDPIPFQTIIHENDGLPQNDLDEKEIPKKINNGTDVDAFIFNFFDYLIWKEKNGKTDFHFTYRTSVEHFYPQNPTGGESWKGKQELNSFGNLCLITNSMNSKFTNQLPSAKYAEYGADEKARELSLKLQEMFDTVEKNKPDRERAQEWNTLDVQKAETKAKNLFADYLSGKKQL